MLTIPQISVCGWLVLLTVGCGKNELMSRWEGVTRPSLWPHGTQKADV